jgi:hypothetical protein
MRTTQKLIFVLILTYAVLLVGARWYFFHSTTDGDQKESIQSDLSIITVVNPDAISWGIQCAEGEAHFLSNMDAGAWQTYSNPDKMGILLQVVAYESRELGFPAPALQEADLDDGVLANYDRANNVINIDSAHLENDLFADNLNSVLHEVRHVYQHELRDMLDLILDTDPAYADLALLKNVKQLKENEEDYQSGLIDFEIYKSQPVEVDARFYASNRLKQLQTTN